jgi:putative oxidoreductase
MFKSACTNIYKAINWIGDALQSPFLLLIRLYWGYLFCVAGVDKVLNLERVSHFFESLGIPLPFLSALLAGSVEMVGGALLVLGLFSRVAAIPLLGVAGVAYYTVGHNALMALFFQFDPKLFFRENIFLFGYATLIIFCFGPGKISLDHRLFAKKL